MTQKIFTLPLATLERINRYLKVIVMQCVFETAGPMYSSAIRPKCLEGIRILRTNLVQIQALTALSCARWAKQLRLSMPKTPQVLRNNSYGKVITMEKMFSHIVKIGSGKLHRFKLQRYLDSSASTDSRLLCVCGIQQTYFPFL